MNKYKIAGVVLGVATMLAPFVASAASITDARFSNSQTNIDATGGSTVSGTFTLTVGSGEVVEWFRLLPNGNPFTDQNVGGQLGYQEGVYTNVPFSVKVPPNTGTYNVDVQGAGIYGGNRSINGGDNVVLGATSVGSVRVVANGSTSGSSDPVVGSDDFWTKITALIAGLIKAQQPQNPAYCASLKASTGNTLVIQSVLVQNGFMTQGQMNTGPGVYGPRTTAAYNMAIANCH